jgi:hypothetical protein
MLPGLAMRGGIAPTLVAFLGACCLILSACSPVANYPSLFPAIHDTPPPRAETPLDSVQVQQATEDLISARDRLSAEAQSSQRQNSARPSASSATAVAAKKQPVALSPVNAASRRPPGSENAQDADTETK